MRAELRTQTQNIRKEDSSRSVYHYFFKGDLGLSRPAVALCGARLEPGNFAISKSANRTWVVCPICEFIHSLTGEESSLRDWLSGTYQLEKNERACRGA